MQVKKMTEKEINDLVLKIVDCFPDHVLVDDVNEVIKILIDGLNKAIVK